MKKTKAARPLKTVVVREELVALTGDHRAAIILSQLMYWALRTKDAADYVAEELSRDATDLSYKLQSGWFYKSAEELAEETMFSKGRNVADILTALSNHGWVKREQKHRSIWKQTYSYRVNFHRLKSDLYDYGYLLELRQSNGKGARLEWHCSAIPIESGDATNAPSARVYNREHCKDFSDDFSQGASSEIDDRGETGYVSDGNRKLGEGETIGPVGPGAATPQDGEQPEPQPNPSQSRLDGPKDEPAPESESDEPPVAPLTVNAVLKRFGYRYYVDTGLDPFDMELHDNPALLLQALEQKQRKVWEEEQCERFRGELSNQVSWDCGVTDNDRYEAIEDVVEA